MQTPSRGRSAVPLTPVLGLGVLIVGLVFAFDSAWYPHWYALFRLVHVTLAVVWVGGGALLTVLALRAERARDADELATIARQAAFAGEAALNWASASSACVAYITEGPAPM